MKSLSLYTFAACLCLINCLTQTSCSHSVENGYEFAVRYQNLPFDMPRVDRPQIPDYEISITEFGGIADGKTLNTSAFANAMNHLKNQGGGRLVVPAGMWLTGPIEFESNVELHVANGALVIFSSDRSLYPIVKTSFEGLNTRRCMSPLTAVNKENIAITGHGSFNGNGQHWRPVKKMKTTENQWKKLCKSGAVNERGNIWYPSERIREVSEDRSFMAQAITTDDTKAWEYVHDYLRPVLLSFIGCKNILLEDATFENSPGWNIHPLMCENVILHRVNIRNPWYAQNGDGLDLESCRNALILDCTFDVGDDAICIKSGKDKDGRERGIPTENVIVEGCTVYHGHGGFVIGSEMSGGARCISVRRCVFVGTDTGLRFKSTRGRGGVVEKIYIDGINMYNIEGDALTFDLYYGIKPGAPIPPVTEETPQFKDIYITHTTCQGAKRTMWFNGLPEMPIQNIVVSNSLFHGETGAIINYVDGVTFENVALKAESGEAITQSNSTGIVVR